MRPSFRRPHSLYHRSQPQVLAQAEPVVRGARQDAGEAPQELVTESRGAERRAVADPARRSKSVGVWCGDERREPLVSHGTGHHPGRHEERGLQSNAVQTSELNVSNYPLSREFNWLRSATSC